MIGRRRESRARSEALRVLHVWTESRSTSDTAIAIQVNRQKIALERFRTIRYEDQPACSPEDLLQRLNSFRPHVLQISAHGDPSGAIAFAHPDEPGVSLLSKQELATLLSDRHELRLLLIDGCYGLVGVEAFVGVVDAVVGVPGPVQEPYPIAFSTALYGSIANGRSLHAAVHDAIVAAADRNRASEPCAFEIWTHGVAARDIYLHEGFPPRWSLPSVRSLAFAGGAVAIAVVGLAITFSRSLTPSSAITGTDASAEVDRVEIERPEDTRRASAPVAMAPPPTLETLLDVVMRGTPPRPASAHNSVAINLEIVVRDPRSRRWTPLPDGGQISDLDDYVILARASTPGFLYVVQRDSSGQIDWLFPRNARSSHSWGSNPIRADQSIQIPEDATLYLDQRPGVEEVTAIFSLTPWLEVERALGRAPTSTALATPERLRNVGGTRRFSNVSPVTDPLEFDVNGEVQTLQEPRVHRSDRWFVRVQRQLDHVARESWRGAGEPASEAKGDVSAR